MPFLILLAILLGSLLSTLLSTCAKGVSFKGLVVFIQQFPGAIPYCTNFLFFQTVVILCSVPNCTKYKHISNVKIPTREIKFAVKNKGQHYIVWFKNLPSVIKIKQNYCTKILIIQFTYEIQCASGEKGQVNAILRKKELSKPPYFILEAR